MNRRSSILLIALSLVLTACAAPAGEPGAVVETVVVTEVVEREGEEAQEIETVEVEVTAPPEAAEPTEVGEVDLTSPPTVQPTQPATPVPTLGVSPTPVEEPRLVELEYPSDLLLGDSDLVRLSLIPSREGYTVRAEFPEHQVDSQDVTVERLQGYDLFAVARLEGVGFQISPEGEQPRSLNLGEPVTWRWTMAPRQPGQQRLFASLILRWVPLGEGGGPQRESLVYSKGLHVRVRSFLGLTRRQAMTTGLFGLIFGGGVSLFALVFRGKPLPSPLQVEEPSETLALELHPSLTLSERERTLLRTLFRRYGRLVLEREFLSGYSGARTFLALPIRPDGRTDAYTIVKLGERSSIQREYENYQTYVKDTLPPITARIQRAPVTVKDGRFAALQYTFIGEPGSTPTSLRQALLENPDPALLWKLFEVFGPNWWMQRVPHTFRLGRSYDRKLPTHYVIEPASGRGEVLDGRTPPEAVGLQLGDQVTLRGFPRAELRTDGKSTSLRGEPQPGEPPLRVRWLSTRRHEGATGRVVATRWSMLYETVAGFDLYGMPDPLMGLASRLNEQIMGTKSTIHGDLNLENVLVGPGNFVWLIDFAMTREDHTPYDFAHLYAEIVAHVLAKQVESAEAFLARLRSGETPLLGALEEIASRCLFNPSRSREFDLAVHVACIGALKFANLDRFAKHLLYLTAAHWLVTGLGEGHGSVQ